MARGQGLRVIRWRDVKVTVGLEKPRHICESFQQQKLPARSDTTNRWQMTQWALWRTQISDQIFRNYPHTAVPQGRDMKSFAVICLFVWIQNVWVILLILISLIIDRSCESYTLPGAFFRTYHLDPDRPNADQYTEVARTDLPLYQGFTTQNLYDQSQNTPWPINPGYLSRSLWENWVTHFSGFLYFDEPTTVSGNFRADDWVLMWTGNDALSPNITTAKYFAVASSYQENFPGKIAIPFLIIYANNLRNAVLGIPFDLTKTFSVREIIFFSRENFPGKFVTCYWHVDRMYRPSVITILAVMEYVRPVAALLHASVWAKKLILLALRLSTTVRQNVSLVCLKETWIQGASKHPAVKLQQ